MYGWNKTVSLHQILLWDPKSFRSDALAIFNAKHECCAWQSNLLWYINLIATLADITVSDRVNIFFCLVNWSQTLTVTMSRLQWVPLILTFVLIMWWQKTRKNVSLNKMHPTCWHDELSSLRVQYQVQINVQGKYLPGDNNDLRLDV